MKIHKIFTEERKENELPADEILNHIKNLKNEASRKKLTIPYLEWLINVKKDTTSRFHDELILHYLSVVLGLKKQAPPTSTIHKLRAGTEPGRLGTTRKLLVEFLESSQYYSPEKILPTFVVNNLYEERAILFSRLEQHKDALRTYVYDMNDTQLAEDYCKKFYDPQNDKRSDVYLYLLNVYLRPDKNMQQQLQPALQLLAKQFDKINPAEVSTLPFPV